MSQKKESDAGAVLRDILKTYMSDMGVVNGLKELGYSSTDIPDLVTGTLPQVSSHFEGGLCHAHLVIYRRCFPPRSQAHRPTPKGQPSSAR